MKRFLSMLCGLCLLLSGCSAVDKGMYKEVEQAVQTTLDSSGGMMQMESSTSDGEKLSLQFSYCYTEDGIMQYCVEQTDHTGRRVFLEHNDGKILQRWLLGHGSLSFDETSTEFTRYTKENPYQYLALLSAFPDKKTVLSMTSTVADGATEYLLELDPEKVSSEQNPDAVLSKRTLRCVISEDGKLKEYEENSTYTDADGKESSYQLCMTLSKLGEISEVPMPEIK